jgi:cytochrome c-type biogenesis protein CcmH
MVWLIIIGLTLAVGAALVRWAPVDRSGQHLIAAFLMLGLAGYAWQGRPGAQGTPVSARAPVVADDGNVRRFLSTGFGAAGDTLGYSDAWLKVGRPDLAVRVIKKGLATNDANPDLWVALGGAMTRASDGVVTPAAQFAFGKAAALDPKHPGPRFFNGLSAAQTGNMEEAARIWVSLYDATPPDALWRQDLEQRLSALSQQVQAVPNSAENAQN